MEKIKAYIGNVMKEMFRPKRVIVSVIELVIIMYALLMLNGYVSANIPPIVFVIICILIVVYVGIEIALFREQRKKNKSYENYEVLKAEMQKKKEKKRVEKTIRKEEAKRKGANWDGTWH